MNTRNLILNTDSYKPSHYLQFPSETKGMFYYVEARGTEIPQINKTTFFGLQYVIDEYLSKPINGQDIDEAEAFLKEHGEPFNREGWEIILNEYNGYLPVIIRAVPEGTIVPTGNVLVTIESTDERLFWVPSYIETLLLRSVWYGTTVATISRTAKEIILKALLETSDDPYGQIPFKLHDFGARGVSSFESAGLGGAAHLINFMGSDTITGALFAKQYYHAKGMPAYSIPAAEHSTITAWGRDRETQAYANMLDKFAKPGTLVAVVSDSYDIYNAVNNIWGKELRDKVKESSAIVVIRPDSGNPPEVVVKLAHSLNGSFGSTINKKGYMVLNNVRIIQGDGVNLSSIKEVLDNLADAGFAADNVAFGMGGALLQKVDRDTFRFAMKCSAVKLGEEWVGVNKSPVGDRSKLSKKGRLELIKRSDGWFETVEQEKLENKIDGALVLETVYFNGRIIRRNTFEEVRANGNIG